MELRTEAGDNGGPSRLDLLERRDAAGAKRCSREVGSGLHRDLRGGERGLSIGDCGAGRRRMVDDVGVVGDNREV